MVESSSKSLRRKYLLYAITFALCVASCVCDAIPYNGTFTDWIILLMIVIYLFWILIINNYFNLILVIRTVEARRRDLEIISLEKPKASIAAATTAKTHHGIQQTPLKSLKCRLIFGYSCVFAIDIILVVLFAVGHLLSPDMTIACTQIVISLGCWHLIVCVHLLDLLKYSIVKQKSIMNAPAAAMQIRNPFLASSPAAKSVFSTHDSIISANFKT